MGQVIAITNQKGGVAKTTSTVNLAYALTQRGKRVLAVDLDPQASLTLYFGEDPRELQEQHKTIYFSLRKNGSDLNSLVIPGSVDLIPSSIQLDKAEGEFILDLTSGMILKDKLDPLRDAYDFILIDCRPTLTILPKNALVAADAILIPAQTDFLSIMGIPDLLDQIEEIRSRANPRLSIIGILPTKHNARYTQDQQALKELQELALAAGIHIFEPIARSTEYDKSAPEARPTLEMNPQTPGVQNYYSLADYIITYG